MPNRGFDESSPLVLMGMKNRQLQWGGLSKKNPQLPGRGSQKNLGVPPYMTTSIGGKHRALNKNTGRNVLKQLSFQLRYGWGQVAAKTWKDVEKTQFKEGTQGKEADHGKR